LRTDELRDAQQQVIRLQEAKDNMLALISHEMRTPLNGILGFIELAKTTELPHEAKAFLSHIEDSALRLEHSTRKALDFAIFSTAGRTIDRRVHVAGDLISAAQAQVASRGEDSLDVECNSREIHRKLLTDGELTVEVLKNLFENSVKYSGPEPRVRVTVTSEGVWDLVVVRDFGPGFSSTMLPSLFQPFSTGNIMHHSEGMGLGLALVDVIMLTLGGRVEAKNHVEGGAEVRLHFPRAESASRP
jgi:two-component system sensor histidine kinase/response regulator